MIYHREMTTLHQIVLSDIHPKKEKKLYENVDPLSPSRFSKVRAENTNVKPHTISVVTWYTFLEDDNIIIDRN